MWKLTLANMCRDTCVASCPCEVLTFAVWDVLAVRVFVALGEAKVDDVDIIFGGFCGTDKEIIWFNISMYNSFFVHFLKGGKI